MPVMTNKRRKSIKVKRPPLDLSKDLDVLAEADEDEDSDDEERK